MSLTREDIYHRIELKNNLKLTHELTKEFVDSFFETIVQVLERGEEVKITGFGNFELKNKNSRPGRNPKTGVDVEISARRVTTFKTGKKLRARINPTPKQR
ncbi:MAG: integration host factor subunit alpha [Succinivibrio sp.]|nr:integration host factor subunit alpha [Succinivibrio sp.]